MNTKNKLVYGLLVLGISLLVLYMFGSTLAEDNDIGGADVASRAEATYVGTETCAGCHADKHDDWSETLHGTDFATEWEYSGSPANKYTLYDGACVSCHVVGYNQLDDGGYDPSKDWDSDRNKDLLGIGCENCHGPGSEHVSASMADKKSTINVDKDQYFESCGGTEDAGCHQGGQYGTDKVPGWTSSVHAPYEDRASTDDEPRDLNTNCASCKSPSQWDPTATRDTAVPVPKAEWRGVTCGDCHDTHSKTEFPHQLKWEPEESCDACHNGGHHETMRTEDLDSTPRIDREDYPYMEDVACVDCHMFNTPHGTPDEYAVIGHTFQPRIEACVSCHTTVYDNMPEEDYPHANWTAWNATLQEALEEWGGVVEASQERYDKLFEEVEDLHDEVEELMETAEENGHLTDAIEEEFEGAYYDFELADHASRGAHNPPYATALLNGAKETFEELIAELSLGTIKGTLTDSSGDPVSDVLITVDGVTTKSATDGTYTINVKEGTYTVTAIKSGTMDQSASSVEVIASTVTIQNFTLADDADSDGTPDDTDTDDDNDGMPDSWETDNNLKPTDPSDAYGDPDNDKSINLQEYIDGTDPQKADAGSKAAVDDKEAGEDGIDSMTFYGVVGLLVVVILILVVAVAMKGKSAPPEPEEDRVEEKPSKKTSSKKKGD